MHYYQFNIGDYASHTRNLSLLEDLAYRRLLDEYYLHEHPLNPSVALVARHIGMQGHEDEVKFILETFFESTDMGWMNNRANQEIEHFRAKTEQASRAGKASAARRFSARSTDVQPTNNQQPITNNQNTKRPSVAAPIGVSPEVWESFVKHRKAKKAQLTELVVNTIAEQAHKAGWTLEKALTECVVRNWQSFRADWVVPQAQRLPGKDVAHMTTPAPPNQDAALKKIESDRKNAVPPPANIKAKMAELTKAMKV